MSRTAAKSNRVIATLKTGAKVVATVIFHMVGFAFVGIAGAINYHASVSQGEYWAYAAVGTTVLTAALIAVATLLFTRRMYLAAVLMIVLALPFFAQNWFTASGNVASADKGIEDARTAHDLTVTSLADRRKDAVDRRDKAKADAKGETTEASALGKIEKIKADRSPIWNASGNCNPAYTTTRAEIKLCGEIADLKAKAEAAKAYAKAVAEIEGIDSQSRNTGAVAAQSTSAGAGATIKVFAAQLGHEMTDEQGARFFEYQRGGGLELAAAIAPAVASLLAWLLFWSDGGKEEKAPKPRASASPVSVPDRKLTDRLASFLFGIIATPAKAAPVVSYPAGSAREFHRRYLEPAGPNDRIKGGDMQKRYIQDCARLGVDPLEKKMLSQALRACGVAYGKDSGGRPHYYGLRWRDVPLPVSLPQRARQAPRLAVDNTTHAMAI